MPNWFRNTVFILSAFAIAALAGCSADAPSEEEGAVTQTTAGLTCPSPTADQCPSQIYNQLLVQPREIRPVGGLIDTSLTIKTRTHDCVPAFIDSQWQWCQMELRTYGSPADPNDPDDPNLEWTLPGPTLRPQKAILQDTTKPPGMDNSQLQPGTRLKLLLKNQLPNNSYPYSECRPAVYQACEESKQACSQQDDEWVCTSDPGQSCVETELAQSAPNCFHGPDVTNIHFHGTHVSPQPHQDFVLLSLFSSNQTSPLPPCQPGDCSYENAVGEYQVDINPFPWNQAPGTHWYHPHKHGSTALQVLNGMAGALLIDGPFDEWLYGYYSVDPDNSQELETFEKVLVVQQVWPDLVFFTTNVPAGYPPTALINGQANPKIQMRLGEVQRWRFIGATMQASAQIQFSFPEGYEVKQISQDGVQFAPQNYASQPLYGPTGLSLSPGNRADFLVKAPTETDGELDFVTFRLFGNVADRIRSRLDEQVSRLGALPGAAGENALFTIELIDQPADMPGLPEDSQWPAMPYYLRDIEGDQLPERTIAYSMTDPATGQPTNPGVLPNGFWINQVQYEGGCANETMTLDTSEQWTVTNDSGPQHPFHIHTNPFQLISNGTQSYEAPYVWMDTIALPTGTPAVPVPVIMRHRFEDYSGVFVNHCHFLGHEDRGMMINLQTVCANGVFGTPQTDGGADDCSVPSTLIDPNPFPACGGN